MTARQIQWNPAVHERWARERLVFWRMGFYPTYRRDEVKEAVEAICARHSIRGRVVYEVFGQHDLLARFWLPPSVTPEDVDWDIKRTLTAFHLELCDMFVVDSIVTHWFWVDESNPEGTLQTPTDDDLSRQPPHHVLREISELVERLNNEEISQGELESHAVAAEYLERGILGIRAVHDGIKFAMVVSVSGELSTRYTAMESLQKQLRRLLDDAKPVMERSLYSGTGFGKFLILGKIMPDSFFSINTDLIAPIVNEASLSGVYRTRSITYIGATPNLMTFSETLALPIVDEDSETVNVGEILAGGENARVEFKGSIFVNVNRWLHKTEREEDAEVTETFVRAVVAMLNNNRGGVVVTGVLEEGVRDYEQLVGFPRTNGLIVLGTEFDWEDWAKKDWDTFENRVRQKVNDAIEPDPSHFVSLLKYRVEGKTLCVAAVTESPPMWFYVRRKDERFDFVVRDGASSVVRSGPAEDTYKRLKPRP